MTCLLNTETLKTSQFNFICEASDIIPLKKKYNRIHFFFLSSKPKDNTKLSKPSQNGLGQYCCMTAYFQVRGWYIILVKPSKLDYALCVMLGICGFWPCPQGQT